MPTSIKLPLLSELLPRGDGTYVLRPISPDPIDLESWLDVGQAARMLQVERHRIYAWCEEGLLVHRRPAPRRLIITLRSVLRLRSATAADPDLWAKPSALARLRAASLQDHDRLISAALT